MSEFTDAEIVQQAQSGDLEAVGRLFDRYEEAIFRYVRSRLPATPAAQDLTGEVFLRMVAALPRYRTSGVPFSAWLYRIAKNLIADYYRKEGNLMTVPMTYAENEVQSAGNPAVVVDRQLTLDRVQQALEVLDESQREVIRLRFLVGLPVREVAESMNKSVAAVKALQHRGLLALRVVLKQEL